MKNAEPKLLKVDAPVNVRGGLSANIVRVTTTANGEVIMDFVFSHPQDQSENVQLGILVSRIVMPTSVAKDLQMVLSSQLGSIKRE